MEEPTNRRPEEESNFHHRRWAPDRPGLSDVTCVGGGASVGQEASVKTSMNRAMAKKAI
jgi:hypothetical protein